MDSHQSEDLLEMLKTLADESRLTLLRLLNQAEYSVGDLAQQVNLGEPTVSHHLARMRAAGLVTLRMAGNQRFYRLHSAGLERFKQLAAKIEQLPARPPEVVNEPLRLDESGWEPWEQAVLREHIQNHVITHLPTKQKKLLVLLRWLANLFQPERKYSETEVNILLKGVYAEDYVSLRRDLIDMGYLRRERGGGTYWLTPTDPDPTQPEETKPQ